MSSINKKYSKIRNNLYKLGLDPDDSGSWEILKTLFKGLGRLDNFKRIEGYFFSFQGEYEELYKYTYNFSTHSQDSIGNEPNTWISNPYISTNIDFIDTVSQDSDAKEAVPFSGQISDIILDSEPMDFEQIKALHMSSKRIIKEFIINKYLTLKLIKLANIFRTTIFINDEEFLTCKHLLLNIPIDDISSFEDAESIDQVAERLGWNEFGQLDGDSYNIPPETEFFGHCSNLQVWAENNYDTRLLHSNLAFPLLKRLAEVGEIIAKRFFKEEIVKRFLSGVNSVQEFLIENDYFNNFSLEDLKNLMSDFKEILNSKHPTMFSQESPHIWKILANIYLRKGDIKKAMIACSKALNIEKIFNKLRKIEV